MINALLSAFVGALIGVGVGAVADKSLAGVSSGFVYLICGAAGAIVGAIAGAAHAVVRALGCMQRRATLRRDHEDD